MMSSRNKPPHSYFLFRFFLGHSANYSDAITKDDNIDGANSLNQL